MNRPFLHSFRESSPNFCLIFSYSFRILLQEDTKDPLLMVVPMKTVTVNQAVCQDPNDTNLMIVLMKAVTTNWAVGQDANNMKLMRCTHQNLQRKIRKHHQVYDPPLEDVNQISCMALIGQHLPKLQNRKLHRMHLSPQLLRGYVFHHMCQNTKHIIN